VRHFGEGSRFVEVGVYLGRSICSLAELAMHSGKRFEIFGIDTCRGSGPEGPRQKDYHRTAVAKGGGIFAGQLHKNLIDCGYAELISLMIADSVAASRLFAEGSIEWVHLDARHDYEGVKADIHAWLPKIKSGGWLSGDDYDEVKRPELIRAVNNLLPDARRWSEKQWRWIAP
jgi:Methyltransferase domain